MGFVSETLSGVDGIQWYYIVGIIVFVGLFIGVVIYTYNIPKKDLDKYKSSIFEKEEVEKQGNDETMKRRK
jgi:cbb3-type cytochrome oxidase subunit 3